MVASITPLRALPHGEEEFARLVTSEAFRARRAEALASRAGHLSYRLGLWSFGTRDYLKLDLVAFI